ncbi:MAG TPA: hypothetical protein VHE23_06230 [Candidatus Acidoferrales bacterium]|nr:hypothetical protein [Candidatus Acidoferrales bacterium]
MKRAWIALVGTTALAAAVAAQTGSGGTSGSTNQPVTAPATLSNGTDVVVELNKTVDAKKAKVGDKVKATVIQDVVSHGRVVIRTGSKLLGHVAEVKPHSKTDPESRLAVIFDKAVLKGGGEMTFNAAIRALAPPSRASRVDQPDLMPPPGMGTTTRSMGSGGPQPMGSPTSPTRGASTTSQVTPANKNAGAQTGTTLTSPIGGASSGGNESAGMLSTRSRGVFGLRGLKLLTSGSQGSVVTCTGRNVKLESGTQIVVKVNGPVGP